jgi:branched-subunit amino acid transport protein
MSAGWMVPITLAIGVYACKSAGPLLLGSRKLPPLVERIAQLAPAGLLAALVMVAAFKVDGQRALAFDARAIGLAVACLALWRKQGFIVVVLLAAVSTAVARKLGMT